MNQSPNRNTGKPTSHRENPHKLADNLGAAVARLELVVYYVQFTQSHLWMHQTWSERERGNGEQSSRGVGRVGTMAAVNSRDKNRLEKRSSRRAWCTFGRHFLSSASARCAVAHVRLRWRRRRRLVAVGENFLFSSLAWQLGRRKGVFLPSLDHFGKSECHIFLWLRLFRTSGICMYYWKLLHYWLVIQPGAVKLVLWRHWMHVTQLHPVA